MAQVGTFHSHRVEGCSQSKPSLNFNPHMILSPFTWSTACMMTERNIASSRSIGMSLSSMTLTLSNENVNAEEEEETENEFQLLMNNNSGENRLRSHTVTFEGSGVLAAYYAVCDAESNRVLKAGRCSAISSIVGHTHHCSWLSKAFT